MHRLTWVCTCLIIVSSVCLNLDVTDALYRLKYGPVRPAIIVSGWPINAVDEDVVSAELHVNRRRMLANAVLTFILAAGAAARLERWKRQSETAARFTSKHGLALGVLAIAVLAADIVNRSGSIVDPIDYVDALRWPAASTLFVALSLTCLTFVDCLGAVARHVSRRLSSPA